MSDAKTRAQVAPPPSKNTAMPFIPDSASQEPARAANNLKDKNQTMLSLNMPNHWHKRFKMTAASQGLTMREFLMECFDTWERGQKK